MHVPDGRQAGDPDRPDPRDPDPRDPATDRDRAERRAYARPRAFPLGPAVALVRGGFYGKDCDGYSGYYTEH